MKNETLNARIESTSLGYEGHGILSSFLYLAYDGGTSSQGFGGHNLSGVYAEKWIKGVLKVLEADGWEDIKGKYIRVKIEDGRAIAIGNIVKDIWFAPSKEWKD